jgi:hypothetical protein
MCSRFLLIEGSRLAVVPGRDGASAREELRTVKYFPSAVNLPVE